MESPSFLFLPADKGACAHYRCHVPVRALQMSGVHAEALFTPRMYLTAGWDVIVLQRQYDMEITWNIELWHDNGQTVLYEIDDLLTEIPPHNPAHHVYEQKKKYVLRFLSEVDGLVVSTEPLARQLRKYNPNVLVVKNYMDLDFWRSGRPKGDTTVGWMGGPTHTYDLELIRGVLDRINARILFAGQKPEWFLEDWAYRRYWPFAATPAVLQELHVGLAPLTKGRFNDCKSAIKYMEYSLMGAATVASDYGPYARTIKHGETGLLAKNPKDWLRYVNRLVKDDALRNEILEAAVSWVRENRSIQAQHENIADRYVEFADEVRHDKRPASISNRGNME